MADLFSPAQQDQQQRNLTPFVVGIAAVLVVVGIIVAFTRNTGRKTAQVNPYVARLQVSNAKVSAAENYVGGTVTYLDFTITNTGEKALTGADVNLTFKSPEGQVVQTVTLPLHVLVENQLGGYPDLMDMERAPIGPGQSKNVRVTIEHVSPDWNQAPPGIELEDLKLKG